jgi:hypothetical protein
MHLDNERSLCHIEIGSSRHSIATNPSINSASSSSRAICCPTRHKLSKSLGHNRCNVSTSEGGAIDEEFYVRYAVDRTETTAQSGWDSRSAVPCHDHKFDPISQKEFYQLYAFFNNANEKAMDGNALLPPPMIAPTPEQKARLAELNEAIARGKAHSRAAAKIEHTEPPRKPRPRSVVTSCGSKTSSRKTPKWRPAERRCAGSKESGFTAGNERWPAPTPGWLRIFHQSIATLLVGKQDTFFAYAYIDPANKPKAIMLQFHTTDWLYRANWGDEDAIVYGDKGTTGKLLMGNCRRQANGCGWKWTFPSSAFAGHKD